MAQLPADRTKLAQAQSNMAPSFTASSQKLKDALTEIYDTNDLLNQKVDNHGAAATLPHADKSVIRAKLADKVVGAGQLDDATVGQSHHQDNGIPGRALPDNVILQRHMSDSSVGSPELQAGAVQSQHLAPGSVTSDKLPGTLVTDAGITAEFDKRGYNVQRFGALGNGVKEDTVDIEKAIDAASSAGGVVFFPAGTYMVRSGITLKSNVSLVGIKGKTILRVIPNCPDYFSLFNDGADGNNTIENIEITGITFDDNAANQVMTAVDGAGNINKRITIQAGGFRKCRIHNNTFLTSGMWCIQNGNRPDSEDIYIHHNVFRFSRFPNVPIYDVSTLFPIGKRVFIHDNTFTSELFESGVYTGLPATCVEAKNCNDVHIHDNSFHGYLEAVIITTWGFGDTGFTTKNVNVHHNHILCNSGIILYCRRTDSLQENIKIESNLMMLYNKSGSPNPSAYETSFALKLGELYSGNVNLVGGAIRKVDFVGNMIIFEQDTRTLSTYANGVSFRAAADIDDIRILNNTIYNAPMYGIETGGKSLGGTGYPASNIEVKGNKLVDCGYNATFVTTPAGVFVEARGEAIFVENNVFIQTGTVSAINHILVSYVDTKMLKVKGNQYPFGANEGARPFPNYDGTATAYEIEQDKIKHMPDITTKATYYKNEMVITPVGTHLIKTTGTTGSLAGVTGSITSGQPALTVNDATNIHVGDWVAVAGAVTLGRVQNKNGNVITLNANATATVSGAAVTYVAPAYSTRKPGNAIPTTGTHTVGDIVDNTAPATGQYAGWVCVVAGTPGTWRGFGQIGMSIGDTASRPATANLATGYLYYDSTLNKPIWWQGSVWKDATGLTV